MPHRPPRLLEDDLAHYWAPPFLRPPGGFVLPSVHAPLLEFVGRPGRANDAGLLPVKRQPPRAAGAASIARRGAAAGAAAGAPPRAGAAGRRGIAQHISTCMHHASQPAVLARARSTSGTWGRVYSIEY
jgi:hypothetical protein